MRVPSLARWWPSRRHPVWPVPLDASDVKLLGSALARRLYDDGVAGPAAALPAEPERIGRRGGLCRQSDIEAGWLRHWCGALRMAPLYHRKVWEDCFVAQTLWEAGMLADGRRGLGFAVGVETLPAFFAARGVDVLATDLPAGHRAARGWQRTGQHSGALEQLFHPALIDADRFADRVRFRALDMNALPPDLGAPMDFLWSVCSVEHLGSVEAGLRFMEDAMRFLRPGGIAVHTMEFNLRPHVSGHLRRGKTVLFERPDLETLQRRLEAAGHVVAPIDFAEGEGVLDGYVDVPPFGDVPGWPAHLPTAPHLRILLRGFVTTSLGIVVEAGPRR